MGFPQSKQVGHLHVQQAYALNEILKEEHWSREEPESRAAPCWNPGGVMLNSNKLAWGTVNVSCSPPSPSHSCSTVNFPRPVDACSKRKICSRMETATKCHMDCLCMHLILATFHQMCVEGTDQFLLSCLFCKLMIEYPVCFPWEKAFPFSQMYMHI